MAARIYLDHAATTPMRPEAIAAVKEGMRRWANPSSPHAEGRGARAALEEARARIKAALDWDGELIFTSGASEALAIGLGRAKAGRRIVSAVEHDAVFRAAPGAEVLPVDRSGNFDGDWLSEALASGERPVVAIQSVNSETGQAQDLMTAAAIVREAGGVLLSDCAQSTGKYPLPRADMVVVSAHKLGGPPGIGALLLRDFGLLEPLGGQEYGYRAGTENLPAALGFAAAVEAPWPAVNLETELGAAVQRLHRAIGPAGGTPVMGYGTLSAWIKAIAMPGMSAAAQLMRFDMASFAVSAGSACSSGTLKPSRVLASFGVDPEVAARTIRVSFGWNTTADEIDAFRNAWLEIAAAAKKVA
ncbi:aminotransferase class V-fold PLP-dependent enzyme [Sphingomonas sp.]|uniref:cysteine desulfurase family protein n=1 Tax=Sphingomonas sp. TaxID=28214 RepID=UPI001B2C2A7C|nr:aminotransferase class V-fold PLP-dependent enzyme [Sphingomonas sp.]MBO9713540.1 aminotransferase class V-fold PLP-dependent enzyme [Sphingomonas sp.]